MQSNFHPSRARRGFKRLAIITPSDFGIIPAIVDIKDDLSVGTGIHPTSQRRRGRTNTERSVVTLGSQGIIIDMLFHALRSLGERTSAVRTGIGPIVIIVRIVCPRLNGLFSVCGLLGLEERGIALSSSTSRDVSTSGGRLHRKDGKRCPSRADIRWVLPRFCN